MFPAPRGKNPLSPHGIHEGWPSCRKPPVPAPVRTCPHNPLNSDGRRHPLENGLTVFTLVAGIVSFATGWVVSLHFIASVTGIAALLVGLYAQLISATRPERWSSSPGWSPPSSAPPWASRTEASPLTRATR